MRFNNHWLVLAIVMWSGVVLAQDDELPHELKSTDQHYSVKMLTTALPGADPDIDDSTITVNHDDRTLAKYPTTGYLKGARWSADGKYVAVNNRRANSGDYLWVFRLSDGHAIKKPVDAGGSSEAYEQSLRRLARYISGLYPEQTYKTLRKTFTVAGGWTDKGELEVITTVQFNNLDDKVIGVFETFAVKGNKLSLVHREIKTRLRGDNEF